MPQKWLNQKQSFSLEDITAINDEPTQTSVSLANINDLKNKNYLSNELQKILKAKKEEFFNKKRQAYQKQAKAWSKRIRILIQKDSAKKQNKTDFDKLNETSFADREEEFQWELEIIRKNMPKKILKQKQSISLENITAINDEKIKTSVSLANINVLKKKNYLSKQFKKILKAKKEQFLDKKRQAYQKQLKERSERIKILMQKDLEKKQILMQKEQANKPQSENKFLLKLEKIEQLAQKIKKLEQRVTQLEQHHIAQKSENMLTTDNINTINTIANEPLINNNDINTTTM